MKHKLASGPHFWVVVDSDGVPWGEYGIPQLFDARSMARMKKDYLVKLGNNGKRLSVRKIKLMEVA